MAKRQPVLTKEQREQRRAEQRELVVASIEQLRSSNGWRAYLTARACFRSYSVLEGAVSSTTCDGAAAVDDMSSVPGPSQRSDRAPHPPASGGPSAANHLISV